MFSKLSELLIEKNLLSAEQLEAALKEQEKSGDRLLSVLLRLGFIEEGELIEFLSNYFGVPMLEPSDIKINPELVEFIPAGIMWKYNIVPVKKTGNTMTIAVDDPSDQSAINDIEFVSGLGIDIAIASTSSIRKAIQELEEASENNLEELIPDTIPVAPDKDESEDEACLKDVSPESIVRLVNFILTDSITKNATEIHVEPYEKVLRVRYRIDGVLYEAMRLPLRLKDGIAGRIKTMAHLDPAEKRLPMHRAIKIKTRDRGRTDFFVSTTPTISGERIMLRRMERRAFTLEVEKLGFEKDQLESFRRAIKKPKGMVLVSGHTGSGRHTTVYCALVELNEPSINIMTVEDPVRSPLTGVSQVQVKEEIGLNFAAAAHAFLKQGADIIYLGELRDIETVEIAAKAALTDKLVLSTLHAGNAPSVLDRLINMKLEPFIVAESVNLVVAQRLVRKICPECKTREKVKPRALISLGMNEKAAESCEVFRGQGCPACQGTGYKGRIGVFELLDINEDIKELVLEKARVSQIKRKAISTGLTTLRQAALNKAAEGLTTLEEVVRVTPPD